MSLTIKQLHPHNTRIIMGVLTDGLELHQALHETAVAHHIHTATIHMLGGLHHIELTAYNFHTQTRHPPLLFQQPLEIIGGHGTISLLENQPHIHLHLTLSYHDAKSPTGISIIGGHVTAATAFAVEFIITAYDGDPIQRAIHPTTGLQLWQPSPPQ
jgi:predicted DNA-binding protein with PD1-like motif